MARRKSLRCRELKSFPSLEKNLLMALLLPLLGSDLQTTSSGLRKWNGTRGNHPDPQTIQKYEGFTHDFLKEVMLKNGLLPVVKAGGVPNAPFLQQLPHHWV